MSNASTTGNETREASIAKNKFQIKISIVFSLLHTTFYLLEAYSFQLFVFMFAGTFFVGTSNFLEIYNPSAGQTLRAILFGTLPAMQMMVRPDYAIISIFAHCFTINLGSHDIDLSKLRYLLGSNSIAWISCYCYLKHQENDDYLGAQEIKNLFGDSHRFSQIIMSFIMNYGITVFLARNKLAEIEVHEKYKSTLLSLNKELESANLKLQKANSELQAALQEKENFILRFSHEIRNPLNSLLGNVELCYEKAHDRELRTMLQDAKVSGEILLQLLNNVLDTAKVAVGKLELSVLSQNFRGFLERAWVICSEIIRNKGLDGYFFVSHGVPECLDFDHHRLMQILINTITNAAKFTENGFVKVYFDYETCGEIQQNHMQLRHAKFELESESEITSLTSEKEIMEKPRNHYESLTMNIRRFQANQKRCMKGPSELIIQVPYVFKKSSIDAKNTMLLSQGYLRLEIIDSGCGINKTDLDTLFTKFSQVNTDSSKRQIGTGLGLWITKEIVELMEGKIDIHSAPNRGTALVIMIKSKVSSPSPAGSPQRVPMDLNSLRLRSIPSTELDIIQRVLVVEDMPYNQEINQRLLQKCNVREILIANNGQEALDIYKKMKQRYFDLILMDIDMPVMDGKTATQQIRQLERENGWNPTSIVFLTAYSEAKTKAELLNPKGVYRGDGFLAKPASLEVIQRTLRETAKKNQNARNKATKTFRFSMNDDQNTKILIVDDDPSNLMILSKMAALCGYKTLEARNGQIALDLYEENWMDIKLILMDCEMPVMDGFEATQKILLKHKKLAELTKRDIKIYGLTGYVSKKYREKCLEVGMKDVLEKPITVANLRSLLLDQKQ